MSTTPLSPSNKPKRRARLESISISGLSPAIRNKLKRRAKRDHRSLSSTICVILRDAVEAEQNRGLTPAA